MKKAMGLLFVVAVLTIIAPPAHAQVLGDGGEVLNRDLPPDQCPTYDSCSMAPGGGADPNTVWAPGMTSCTANRCTECGNDAETGKATCFLRASGLPGGCKCTVTTTYNELWHWYETTCTTQGSCTLTR